MSELRRRFPLPLDEVVDPTDMEEVELACEASRALPYSVLTLNLSLGSDLSVILRDA